LVLAENKDLGLQKVSLDFASHVVWDLTALVNDIVDWLNNSEAAKTSKAGTLSSPQFFDLVQPVVEDDMRMNFQRMIYGISLAYTQLTGADREHLHIRDLLQTGSIAGHSLLKALDEKLKPQSLKRCSRDGLQALFLLVFGTILAVGYTQCRELPQEWQCQFKPMQDHLCQILAHYVVYLASQLKLTLADSLYSSSCIC
jgi:hypothetical protein